MSPIAEPPLETTHTLTSPSHGSYNGIDQQDADPVSPVSESHTSSEPSLEAKRNSIPPVFTATTRSTTSTIAGNAPSTAETEHADEHEPTSSPITTTTSTTPNTIQSVEYDDNDNQQQHHQQEKDAESFNDSRDQFSWFAKDPSKAYYERFSLMWAPFSMFCLLVFILGTPIYERCDRNSFLILSLLFCLPGFIIPLCWPCQADINRPILQRFWVKAAIWISIFGFYGNYFWTHYFYNLLGAEYLFDSYQLNDVPLVTYICTYFYFTFYFTFVNIVLRRVKASTYDFPTLGKNSVWGFSIFVLSYGTAWFEALTIQHFPLYTYKQRDLFLVVGSVVYALYFVVGFPMFFVLDEDIDQEREEEQEDGMEGSIGKLKVNDTRKGYWTIREVAISAFAACAIVTLLLDFWRLIIGSIYELGTAGSSIKVPFIYQQKDQATIAMASQAAAASIPPVSTTEYVYIERPVTVEACMEVAKGRAKGWAEDTMASMSKLLNKLQQ